MWTSEVGECISKGGVCIPQVGSVSHKHGYLTTLHRLRLHITFFIGWSNAKKKVKKVLPRFQPCLKSASSVVSTELCLRNKKDGLFSI